MAIRDLSKIKSERDSATATIIGYEAQLAGLEDKESDSAYKIRGMIAGLRETVDDLDRRIEDEEIRNEKRHKRSNWKTEKPVIDQVIDENAIGYIIPENKFIYCHDFGAEQNNVQFKMFPATQIVRMLAKLSALELVSKDSNEMVEYFHSLDKTYLDITSSFNRSKWKESHVYNKMSVIQQHWLQPDFDHCDDYDRDIDILIECIGGGRAENVEHLERWVAFKYLNPNKNANIPNLDLGGMPGGNGKTTFVSLLKTIFTSTCVVQAHREELEKFNASWEMAVVLYYEEPEEKELAASKLKQATGSEDMRVEKKGIDATMADRNYNFIFCSNNPQGVVKLSGGSDGGEDRRYSVINTDVVLLDVFDRVEPTTLDAKKRLNRLVSQTIRDKTQVARWLAHLIRKHQVVDMETLAPLHGHDYHARFDDQKDSITQAFDAILPEFIRQEFISLTVLTEIVRAHTGNMNWLEHNVSPKWSQYLKRNRVDFVSQGRIRNNILWKGDVLKSPQGKVFVLFGSDRREWEYSAVLNCKPNYGGIGIPIAKDSLLIA
jgi:hypothetical protein